MASSLRRVPQVGHSLEAVLSVVIVGSWEKAQTWRIIPDSVLISVSDPKKRKTGKGKCYTNGMEKYSIYLHIPFCKQRCTYCDFNTYAGLEAFIPAYVRALCREVEDVARSATENIPVHTIFFGGGTPSSLSLDEVGKITRTIRDEFSLLPDAEMTLEANPGTLSKDYLYGLRSLGINRLSIGMQSALEHELRLLGRIHTVSEVIQSVEWARQAGFENINLDLIFGIPNQSLNDWRASLETGIGLNPEHFSLYALTLEEDTPMAQWIRQGTLVEAEADLAAEMYELAGEELEKRGYESYEISNWATKGTGEKNFTCQHNLQYWRGQPYLGLGAGAHGYANHTRTANTLLPMDYIEKMSRAQGADKLIFPVSPAAVESRNLSQAEEIGEYMMMGLRLTQEGVTDEVFSKRFGTTLEDCYPSQIQRLTKLGLLEWVDSAPRRLRLTVNGRLLGNQVFKEFI